jgi:DNA-binding SARP family transcriptional activator
LKGKADVGKLELKLLGVPEARLDGRVLNLRTKKALALLVYLVVERGPHPREELAELLWPKSGRSKDRMALRSALADLRRALGETEGSRGARLLVERNSLSFNATSGTEIDLETVHAAFEAARTSSATSRREPPQEGLRREPLVQLDEAADAYRGEFLQGFYLDDAPEFDYWANVERERWRTEAGLVFDRLSQSLQEAGAIREAVDVAEQWVDHDPLSEDTNVRLMQALHALGDTADALQVYEQYRSTLKQNQLAEPGPEAEALAARIEAENRQTVSSRPSARSATRLPEPPFVGRSEEFGVLVEEYHFARGGSARAVAVAGEAGIGKTRLVEQFLRWALAEGADVLKGTAFEATGGLPYGPLVGALRERVDRERAPDDLLDDVWLSELSRLLPELNERYPDLPPPVSDEVSAKVRLFEAVATFVAALAERKPVVFSVDDLQWADAATLDLLRYASRRWAEEGAPVLLMMAARNETPELRARLTQRQAGFSHDLPMRRMVLGPLTEEDTVRILRSLASPEREGEGEETARLERFGGWLHNETGGQPFFLSETLSALVERGVLVRHRDAGGWTVGLEEVPGGIIPPGVREAIVGRLARLGPDSSKLLAAAAILGRPSGFEDLRRVAGMDEDEGLSALEEVLASGLLREVAGDAASPLDDYACAHDVIRGVIYTEAGGARRSVYHRRALELLEQEGTPAAELAHHALAAGLSDEAFRHLLAAGDEAMALFAASDAVEHYESARKLLGGALGQPGGSPSIAEVEHLYANLGRAYELSGEWEKARTTYLSMLTASKNEREPALECVALNRLAILLVQRFGDIAAATDLLEEALEVAEKSGDKAAQAETEWNLAQMAIHGWEPDAAVARAEKALELARRLGLEELTARSLGTLAVSYSFAGRWEECVAHAREAAALFARMGERGAGSVAAQFAHIGSPPSVALHNRAMEAQCLVTLTVAEVNRGEIAASVDAGRAALKIGREINNEWMQALAATNLSQGLIEEGRLGEALRTAQEGARLARKVPDPVLPLLALYAAGNAHQAILRLEEAQTMYQEALEIADTLPRPWRSLMVRSLCANRALADDDWEAAHGYALEAVELRNAAPASLMWLDFVRYHETKALLRGGNEELAGEDAERLGERVGENRRLRLVHLRMLAVLAEWDGKRDEAIAYLQEAQILAEQIGLPGELWQIWAALGDLHKGQEERDAAQVAFDQAGDALRTLIENITDEGLREGFLDAPLVRHIMEESKGAV